MNEFNQNSTEGYTNEQLAEFERRCIITGRDAIDYAEAYGVPLNKYADPVDDAEQEISIERAQEVAREDEGLIWTMIEPGTMEYDVVAQEFSDEVARR